MLTILKLVAAVTWKVVNCPVYEPLLHFVCTCIDIKINGEIMHTIEILTL